MVPFFETHCSIS